MYQEQLAMVDQEKQLHIRVPRELFVKLKVKCAAEDVSIQDCVINLIMDALEIRTSKGVSVLIVEDEEIVRDSLRDSLKDSHEVGTVGSAEEAVELLKQRHFDVVLADVRLPGKSGVQLVEEIKEARLHTVPIVMTAYPSVQLAVDAVKRGAVDYLVKPVNVQDLEKLFEKYYRKKETRGPKPVGSTESPS